MGVNISLNKHAEKLMKREDVCTHLEGEIDIALRNIHVRERNCDAKFKKLEGNTKIVERGTQNETRHVAAQEEHVQKRRIVQATRGHSCQA